MAAGTPTGRQPAGSLCRCSMPNELHPSVFMQVFANKIAGYDFVGELI
jgi:hypothetical protein